MTDTANFFYRVDAGRFLAAVVKVPEAERGEWVLSLALDLVASDAEAARSEYALTLIAEADAYRNVKVEAGRKGGRARVRNVQAQLKQNQAVLKQNEAPLNDTQARSSNRSSTKKPSSSSSDDGYSEVFETFWKVYPKKVKKGAAFRMFQKKRLGNGRFASVMDGLERWQASRQWAEGFVHDPTTWLNSGCYDDEPEGAARKSGGLVL